MHSIFNRVPLSSAHGIKYPPPLGFLFYFHAGDLIALSLNL
jgi:hypothetical protein